MAIQRINEAENKQFSLPQMDPENPIKLERRQLAKRAVHIKNGSEM